MNYKEDLIQIGQFKSGLITNVHETLIPDDAFTDCQNIELDDRFVVKKCSGYRKYNYESLGNKPILGGCEYTTSDGTTYIVVACGGKIYYSVYPTGTFTSYKIGNEDLLIDEDAEINFVQYNGCLWAVNGRYPIILNNGYNTSKMIKINGTTVTSITGSNIPSGAKYIAVHKERLFLANVIDNPSGVFWSEPYNPEDWTPDYGVNYDYLGKDDGEDITGLVSFQGSLFVSKPHNLYRYITDGDIIDWRVVKVGNIGWLYNRTVCEHNNRLYFLSLNGVVMFDGVNIVPIDENVKNKILSLPQMRLSKELYWLNSKTTDFNNGVIPSIISVDNDYIKPNNVLINTNEIYIGSTTEFESGNITNLETKRGYLSLPTRKYFLSNITLDKNPNTQISSTTYSLDFGVANKDKIQYLDNFGGLVDITTTNPPTSSRIGLFAKREDYNFFGQAQSFLTTKVIITISLDRKSYVSLVSFRGHANVSADNGSYRKVFAYCYLNNVLQKSDVVSLNNGDFNTGLNMYCETDKIVLVLECYGREEWKQTTNVEIWSWFRGIAFQPNSGYASTTKVVYSQEIDTYCKEGNYNFDKFISSDNAVSPNTSITYEIASYDVAGTGWNNIPSSQKQVITSGVKPTIPKKRYLMLKATLNSNSSYYTPTLYNSCIDFETTGSYISRKINLTNVVGYLVANYSRSGQAVLVYYRTSLTESGLDNASWVLLNNNVVPTSSLLYGSSVWVQFKVEISSTSNRISPIFYWLKFITFVSNSITIDYKYNPPSYGKLVHNGSNIIIYTKSSLTDLSETDWNNSSGWVPLNNGVIQSTTYRYLRYKIVCNSITATISSMIFSCYYRTEKKHLPVTPVDWGYFEVDYETKNKIIRYYIRTADTEAGIDSATWVEIEPNKKVNKNNVSLRKYVQIQIYFETDDITQVPYVEAFKLKYYDSIQYKSPCAVIWKDNYLLNVAEDSEINNVVYKYSKYGFWLKFTERYNNQFIKIYEKLYSCGSKDGFVREEDVGTTYDGVPIEAYFITKKFQIVPMIKNFKEIIITSNVEKPFKISYYIDDNEYVMIIDQTSYNVLNRKLDGIQNGNFIKMRFDFADRDDSFEFYNLILKYIILRQYYPTYQQEYYEHWGYGYWGEENVITESQYWGGF